MPEGPSIVIAKERIQQFVGKKVLSATGYSKINKDQLLNKKITAVKSWGKHLLICFNDITIRIHFLMFGTYSINERKDTNPVLSLRFAGDQEFNIYTASVKLIDQPPDRLYDWSADVLNEAWDAKAARKKLKAIPDTLVADALLDQTIFSGVGNIIKNEVLYRIKVHPKSKIGALPAAKLTALIKEARNYSFDFLKWKKEGTLQRHWLAHTKTICKRDGATIHKEYIGKTKRRTFFCNKCQVMYKITKQTLF